MRKWHRWVMTVFAILFVYWSTSGLTLAIYDLTDAQQGWADGGGPGLRPVVNANHAVLPAESVASSMTAAIATAQRIAPSEPITAVELRQGASGVQASVDIGGAQARTLKLDLLSGVLLTNTPIQRMVGGSPGMGARAPGAPRNLHAAIKDWHRGNIVGLWGVGVAMFTGIALLVMSVTGIWLYFSLWRRRRAVGRSAFFWS